MNLAMLRQIESLAKVSSERRRAALAAIMSEVSQLSGEEATQLRDEAAMIEQALSDDAQAAGLALHRTQADRRRVAIGTEIAALLPQAEEARESAIAAARRLEAVRFLATKTEREMRRRKEAAEEHFIAEVANLTRWKSL